MVSKRRLKRQIRRNSINVFTVFFAVLFIISLFFSISTFAEVSPFKIESATIVEKSDDVLGDITDFNDEEILNNIVFHKLNDSVTYKLVIKNNKDNEITILGISDDNSSEFIEYEYDKHENEKVGVNSSFDLLIKTTYKNLVADINNRNQTNTVKFTISYLEDDKVKEDSISINPNTGDNIHLSYILLIISTGGLIVCRFLKKKKSSKVATLVLCILILSPVIVDAATFTYNVSFKTDISLYDKQIITYVIDGVEHTLINDYNTVIDNLDEPEKDGYAFTKWTYEDGSDFDITKPVKSDIKIIANFDKITNVVIFDAHNGIFSNDSSINIIEYYNNKYFENTEYKEPEKSGYRFDGWNTKLDGSGDSYSNEQAVLNNIVSLNTKTLYAQWVKLEATFDVGNWVHQKIKILAGTDSSDYTDKNITAIKRSYVKPDISNFTYSNILSSNNSPVPIYGWFDNGTIYYWTEDLDPSFDANCTGMFYNLENVKTIDLDTVDTSNVTNMSHMFSADKNLVNLDLSSFDTSNVTNMYSMFSGCNSLESLNISSFDTSNVNSMEYMFDHCSSLTDLDLSSFNTSNVTTMYRLLYECSSLKNLNISNFDMSNVTNVEDMIPNTITKIIAKNTKYNNKSKNIYFSKKNLLELDLSGSDTSKVTNMGAMFSGCEKLTSLDVSSFDTSNVTSMRYMFSGCSGLTSLDLSNFNTSNVTDMAYMFSGCSNLTNLTINRFNTSNVENMSYMFYGCTAMTDLNLTNFNTSNVKDMSYMFAYCYGLTNLNVSSFNTINVEKMQNMFSHNNFTSLNLSNFDTRNVTNMTEMFSGCTKLTSLDLSNFNTANVQKMKLMFRSCRSLTSLNISSFNTSKITDMTMMFQDCTSLKTLDLSSFDTSNVLDMSWMFQGDKNLISVNLSSFNTINTTDMSEMFRDCTSIVELDLSSFNTSSLTDIGWMINKNPNLKTIYVNPAIFTLNNVTSSGAIFDGCTSIVGGKGTTYRGTSLAYARVDDPDNGNPGYFTDIADKPVNP